MPDVIPNEPLLNQFIDSVIANSQNAQEVIVTATESVANRVAKSATKKKAKIKKAACLETGLPFVILTNQFSIKPQTNPIAPIGRIVNATRIIF